MAVCVELKVCQAPCVDEFNLCLDRIQRAPISVGPTRVRALQVPRYGRNEAIFISGVMVT